MRKIFTILAVAMAFTMAHATTFNFSSEADMSQTKDGITVTLDKGAGNNAPAVYSNHIRLYASNTITVLGSNLEKIQLSFTKQGTKDYASLTASGGNLVSGGASTSNDDIKTDVWTGSGSSVTFTLGTGQRIILNMIVNGDGTETPPVSPDPSDPTTPDTPSTLDPDYVYAEPTVITAPAKTVQGDAYSFVANNVEVACTKGAITDTYFSAHAGFDMTFTATRDIKGIVINGFVKKDFTATADHGKISYLTPDSDTESNPVVVITDIDSKSVTLSCVKQLRCYKVELYFDANPEATIGGSNTGGNTGGDTGKVVKKEFDSAEIVFESEIYEYFGPNFTVMLFDEANYDFPFISFDIYPATINSIVGNYTFSDYSLSEFSYYCFGEGEDDYTFATDGNVTIKKKGTTYNITGSLTCENGTTYEVIYTGVPDFYSDNQYWYEYDDGWTWNDMGPDSDDFDSSAVETASKAGNQDEDAPMYDMMGRKVGKNYRGIYIQNGKKRLKF